MQTGRSALIKKDGGEMLVAIALDRPLADAQALVSDPQKLIEIILKIIRDGFYALFFLQKKNVIIVPKDYANEGAFGLRWLLPKADFCPVRN